LYLHKGLQIKIKMRYSKSADLSAKEIVLEKGVLIGKGSYGDVYFGNLRNGHGRQKICAIKQMILDEDEDNDYGFRKFTNEIATMRMCKHKNIIVIFSYHVDFGKNIDDFYDLSDCVTGTSTNYMIIMEYCENGNLKHYLNGSEVITIEEKIDLLKQIAEGVMYLHSKKLVHRDLKPANILITRDGIAKLCDFGDAKYMTRRYKKKKEKFRRSFRKEIAKLTEISDSICGSPSYISPELCTIVEDCGYSSEDSDYSEISSSFNMRKRLKPLKRNFMFYALCDIYSFGVIAWEVLSGIEPYSKLKKKKKAFLKDPFDLLFFILKRNKKIHGDDVFFDMSKIKENVPAKYREMITKCIQRDPSLRPESFSEILETYFETDLESEDDNYSDEVIENYLKSVKKPKRQDNTVLVVPNTNIVAKYETKIKPKKNKRFDFMTELETGVRQDIPKILKEKKKKPFLHCCGE